MKFFDRTEEINEILNILKKEPNDIYFIFGPINSGKTTLIKHIIENKLSNNYQVFYINFRTCLISEKREFIEAIFTTKKDTIFEKIKDKKEVLELLNKGIKIFTGVPIPEADFDNLFEKKINDAFQYLNDILLETKKSGKIPILIFDELQMIKEVVLNGQRYLLKELFQFLVSLTKEQHLCHVFCLSSDSLFIEYVYNAGELEGRAKYLLVNDFDKETALKFMNFLAVEYGIKLTNREKELIYSYVGGKAKDINYVVEEVKYKNLNEILDELLNNEILKLGIFLEKMDYIEAKINIDGNLIKVKKEDVLKALKLFKENYAVPIEKIPMHVRNFLVEENILFLNLLRRMLNPQSFLIWNAIKRVVG
ncbi:ATP-binding protein [Methanotorris igneus]|uniref:AAA ATPase n=1 Tax=Methanotorris igneus (strain DSM 5666 / JCM 11834 / Kol 5) TaxID=880724 RepID=F6BD58_METIK|nr:ATP-binding protein [Methanotorris igneus]AEF96419.1 AAA ATPase [Methanotorris igneus Kol 5]